MQATNLILAVLMMIVSMAHAALTIVTSGSVIALVFMVMMTVAMGLAGWFAVLSDRAVE